jgi:hypothetical protein
MSNSLVCREYCSELPPGDSYCDCDKKCLLVNTPIYKKNTSITLKNDVVIKSEKNNLQKDNKVVNLHNYDNGSFQTKFFDKLLWYPRFFKKHFWIFFWWTMLVTAISRYL